MNVVFSLVHDLVDSVDWSDRRRPVRVAFPPASVAVAEDNLLTFDPVNDRKGGPVLKVNEVPQMPGSSGVQMQVQPSLLLEGYRPKRIVRVYPSSWPVIALPKAEELFGR